MSGLNGTIFDRKPLATARGRIRPGAFCFQDHRFFKWPSTAPETSMVFTFELTADGVAAWADGFGGGVRGRPGSYGNGEIHIMRGPAVKDPK